MESDVFWMQNRTVGAARQLDREKGTGTFGRHGTPGDDPDYFGRAGTGLREFGPLARQTSKVS